MEHIFRDITKILVKLPSSASYSINPTLGRLILSEGFTFLGNQDTSPVYKHAAKDLEIMVSGALLSEEDDMVYGVIRICTLQLAGELLLNSTTLRIYVTYRLVDRVL